MYYSVAMLCGMEYCMYYSMAMLCGMEYCMYYSMAMLCGMVHGCTYVLFSGNGVLSRNILSVKNQVQGTAAHKSLSEVCDEVIEVPKWVEGFSRHYH